MKTDLTSGVSKLTNQLIEIEKQKLMNQGKKEVNNLLGDLLGGNINSQKEPTETKTTQTDSTKTSTESTVEKEIKNVLGGLLGAKKKKKDTIN